MALEEALAEIEQLKVSGGGGGGSPETLRRIPPVVVTTDDGKLMHPHAKDHMYVHGMY